MQLWRPITDKSHNLLSASWRPREARRHNSAHTLRSGNQDCQGPTAALVFHSDLHGVGDDSHLGVEDPPETLSQTQLQMLYGYGGIPQPGQVNPEDEPPLGLSVLEEEAAWGQR